MIMNQKLFLTSAGLPKEIRDPFIKLLPKKPEESTVAFIPTAADPYADKWFVEKDKELLKEMGMKIQEVDLKTEKKDSLLAKLSDFDVIYIAGGNTFYLLYWIRKSGFEEIINQLLNDGKIYVGSSAGSIIMGPDIELAGWDDINEPDEMIITLENTTALNIVPFVVSPHFVEKDKEPLSQRSKTVNYPIIAINDKQAVLCIGDKHEIVGEGEKIVYNSDLT